MANSVSHAALPYPIKNARYTLEYVGLDADGDPTDPTTPDTEITQDGGSYADAAEEITTITGGNGSGYITLTGAETNNSLVLVCAKVASGPKATLFSLRPRHLAIVGSGTLSAGSAGGGTLGTLLGYDVTGCFIRTTGGTGGGGTGGANNQARRIITYSTGTGAFTVSPNWETAPSTDTTYDVLLPEGVTLGMLKTLNPTTAGRTLVVDAAGLADANVVKVGPTGSGTAQTARDIGASVLLSNGTGTGQLKLASGYVAMTWADIAAPTTAVALTGTTIASTQKVDIETIKTNPVVNAGTVTFPTTATLASTTNITAGTITTCTNLTNAPTAGDLTATMKTSVTTAATAATPTAAAVTGAVGSIATGGIASTSFAAGAITASAIAADAIGASELATDAVTEIAAAVWNSAMSSYQTAGTMGLAVNELDTIYTNAYDGVTARVLANVTHANGTLYSTAVTTPLASVLADTNELQTDWANGGRLDLILDGVAADGPNTPTKNVAYSNFMFMMVDATDLSTPETGVTVTATISKDGGAFASCSNSVSEVSGGWYKITFTSTEMNADVVALKMTGTGCAQRNIVMRTQPT